MGRWLLFIIASVACGCTGGVPIQSRDTDSHDGELDASADVRMDVREDAARRVPSWDMSLKYDLNFDFGGEPIVDAENGRCVPEGHLFTDYFSCPSIVGPQGDPSIDSAAQVVNPDPARLEDPDLEWSVGQLRACSCICCHGPPGSPPDGPTGEGRYLWDYTFAPTWTDSVSNTGLSKLSSAPPVTSPPAETNHGFDRNTITLPTNNPARMKAFLQRELERRR